MKTLTRLVPSVCLVLAVSTSSAAFAADQSPDAKAKDDSRLAGFNFGLGVGVSGLSEADILETQIEQGVVRVTDSEKTKRGIWLETHYLLDRFAFGPYISHGPFFALQVLDGSETIKGTALGYMISMKRTPIRDQSSKAAFNLGLGVHSTKIKVLGDGIQANQPLPTGVESVRLKSKDETGLLLMFSVSVF